MCQLKLYRFLRYLSNFLTKIVNGVYTYSSVFVFRTNKGQKILLFTNITRYLPRREPITRPVFFKSPFPTRTRDWRTICRVVCVKQFPYIHVRISWSRRASSSWPPKQRIGDRLKEKRRRTRNERSLRGEEVTCCSDGSSNQCRKMEHEVRENGKVYLWVSTEHPKRGVERRGHGRVALRLIEEHEVVRCCCIDLETYFSFLRTPDHWSIVLYFCF